MIATYCTGQGFEVGPGQRPYGRKGTIFVDNLDHWTAAPIDVGVLASADDLPVADDSLDYLISSHCLEHCPDTILVLREWRRALKVGGHLVLILPHIDRTFDRGRPVSTYKHHQEEFSRTDPLDPAHWEDFERTLLPLDPRAHAWLTEESLRTTDGLWDRPALLRRNLIHYHAWTQHEIADILQRLGFRLAVLIEEMPDRTDSFMAVASVAEDEQLSV